MKKYCLTLALSSALIAACWFIIADAQSAGDAMRQGLPPVEAPGQGPLTVPELSSVEARRAGEVAGAVAGASLTANSQAEIDAAGKAAGEAFDKREQEAAAAAAGAAPAPGT